MKSARDSAQHVGDTAHSIRRAILAVPKSTLKLMLPYLKSLELQKEKDEANGVLGLGALKRPLSNDVTKIVGAGRLLDLLRAVASDEGSYEKVGAPQGPMRCKYKYFLNRLKEKLKDKIISVK